MNSEESSEYTWKILEENHVIVPIHLKNILCNLGYIGIRVLAKIDDSTIKEIEEFVSKVLGSAEMTKNMSLTEKQEQFGKTFASKPECFMLSPGDKAVLCVISEVCTQILESYSIVSFPPDEMKKKFKIKHSKATTRKSVGDEQPNSKSSSDIELGEEATTAVKKLTLEQHVLRWGNRRQIENMPSLFSIKDNIVICLIKQSNSVTCNCELKAWTDSKGHWKISSYTKHVQQQHIGKFKNISAEMAARFLTSSAFF